MVVYAFMTPIFYVIFALLTISNVKKTKRLLVNTAKRNGVCVRSHIQHQTLNTQLLRMLLVQVLSYIVLFMPFAVWSVYTGVSSTWIKSQWQRSLEALLSVCFRFLAYANNGSSCVVYALTARLFRQELRALLSCKWTRFSKNQPYGKIFSIGQRVGPAPIQTAEKIVKINNNHINHHI
ncbi:unnamed protein product [Rotaria sordida]|uniref:G-protein coupled receptors family 1 profile domain-containing protein n=1 Tax=Rotaria sordida TaxID=392033 RepID=A0A819VD31_9BILA|nr:unnamed protein product [Rotaria sordida]CAF4107242.1 unnamed protein product [Rotaria sordida]